MATSLQRTNRDPDANHAVSLPLHRAILDAIRARKPKAAIAAMTRHLQDTKRRRQALGGRAGARR